MSTPPATAPASVPAAPPAPGPGPVTAYLSQGGFARAVVARLARSHDVVLPVDDGLVSALVPYADYLVLVADPDQEVLREAVDSLSFTRGVPSVGLELLPTELRCGPLVVPGRSACYRCYMRRRHQHGYHPLPAGPGPLPQGYAYHHVVTAAGLVSLALEEAARAVRAAPRQGSAEETGEVGGQVWAVDLVSGALSRYQTVAVDRCRRCSGRYAAARDGVPALAGLLGHRRQDRQEVEQWLEASATSAAQ